MALFLPVTALAAPLDPPNVGVYFIVNGTLTPSFGIVNDPVYASNSVASTSGDPYTYAGSAWSTYGAVGASSSFSDANTPIPPHGLLSVTTFVDQLYITSSESSSASYRWTPLVHLTGQASWTENGTVPSSPPWPVAVASAQGVKTSSSTNYVFKSSPDVNPGNGDLIDMLFELPEVIVPANEWFNYRFSFLINARVLQQGGYSVSAANGNFMGTMRVVGLDVKDLSGTPLSFTVRSASGSSYTANGITAIPEPSTLGLSGAGFLLLVWSRTRRGA